jgi:hypothetical protein
VSRPPPGWADSPLLGERAPELAGASLLSGETFDLDDQRGRFVVVNSSRPGASRAGASTRTSSASTPPTRAAGDARVVSVVFSDEAGDVERFFEERGGDWRSSTTPRASSRRGA